MRMREAVFAGSWYPGEPEACRRQIESFFEKAPPAPESVSEPVGGIVPHAGWIYSGRLAGEVIALLRHGPQPETVLLFGGHLGPRSKHVIMAEGAWRTPFGPAAVDGEMAQPLLEGFSLESESPERAQPDNTLELQLPFVRYAFPAARILPIAVAPTDEGILIGERCALLARELGRKVRVVGSTDLTHYGAGYGFTPHGRGQEAHRWVREINDFRVIEAMKAMDAAEIVTEALAHRNACCPGAAAAAIACIKKLGARLPQVVEYATSRDVHPGDDFVGYVGLVYWA